MTERIGETKIVKNYIINPPIYMGLDSFANALHASRYPGVEQAKGFLYLPFSSFYRAWDEKNSTIIESHDIQKVFYTTTSCCKEFLVLKDDGHACFEDNVAKNSYQDAFKIFKLEDYQLGDRDKVILNSIEKAENLRKSKQ
ncbi:MAG: hypothetical protein V1678_01190 [Candidatus Aenigmatarchaeota archaeon]